MKKRWITFLLSLIMVVSMMSGCKEPVPQGQTVFQEKADISAQNNTTYLIAGVDDLGRKIEPVKGNDPTKQVGIFYFLWLGASSAEGPYDVSKITAQNPNAAQSAVDWLLAGGGAAGQRHWWGESIFGYFRSTDEWVAERDIMMLTDAGVDFVAMDYSNATEYPAQLLVFLNALDKYYKQGYDVPQVTFITKASSGQVVNNLYEQFYKGHPEFSHLWYCLDGKPLMIGDEFGEGVTVECHDYFTWRYNQWPRESFHDDGFPWMDFTTPQTLYGNQTGTTIMSVSLAQHLGTKAFSSSALYGDDTNHTRSWHDGANDKSEDAVLHGYNFAEQFEYAIEVNPDIIFVTGWNEWIATRQSSWTDMQGNYMEDPIILVDCCNINNSRDIQPMTGGYGDNYYMQLINYIRQYKGAVVNNKNLNTAAKPQSLTMATEGDFSQWNKLESFYLDYTGDVENRDHKGFGTLKYTDDTGRNDLYKMKMTNDGTKLYAYAETVSSIMGMDNPHCMSLFISTGKEGSDTWCGYDYVINRTALGVVEKRTAGGWQEVGTASYKTEGNKLQLSVDLSLLGLSADSASLQFKWADNYQGEDDIFSFYLNCDCAPYGRMNYVYQSAGTGNLPQFEIRKSAQGGDITEKPVVKPEGVSLEAEIVSYEVTGSWSESRVWPDGNEDKNTGPANSIDRNAATIWNPCAITAYQGEPAITYELDGTYDLEYVRLTFNRREYYFKLYGSTDGENYQELAYVHDGNFHEMYEDGKLVCQVDCTGANDIKYVKIVFCGSNSSDNNQWVSLAEVFVQGKL